MRRAQRADLQHRARWQWEPPAQDRLHDGVGVWMDFSDAGWASR